MTVAVMHWRIDFHSGVPVYLQLAEQVRTAVATGLLRHGDQVPSVRALAEELRVNRNTVSRAYGELEREGILLNHQGLGCFVNTTPTPLRRAVRTERLAEALDALLVQAHHLQVDDASLRALFEERLRRFREASTLEREDES
jgi:DNA-binding transcriptional regulator YhcF (GntR family)